MMDVAETLDGLLRALVDARRRNLEVSAYRKSGRALRGFLEALSKQDQRDALTRIASRPGWLLGVTTSDRALASGLEQTLLADHPDRLLTIDRVREAVEGATRKAEGAAVVGIHRWSPGDGAHSLQLRVAVPHLPPGNLSMCWAVVDLAGLDPVVSHLALQGSVDRLEYLAEPAPSPVTPGPLDRFHPERFRTNHRYVDKLGSLVQLMRENGGHLNNDMAMSIQQAVIPAYNQQMFELPHAAFDHLPTRGSLPLVKAASLASYVLQFRASGRQIFDLPPGLVERFRETDVDDVPLNMLRLPYSCFYLYFGPQLDMELEPGWPIDGAYITGPLPNLMQVLVTSMPPNADAPRWWPVEPEPYYYQAFLAQHLGCDVGTAVDTVLSDELRQLQEASERGMPGVQEAAREFEREYGAENVPQVKDVSRSTSTMALETMKRRHPVYLKALRLVVNSLCYLTAYPDDSAATYPASAPRDLVSAAESEDARDARKATNKLAELGYLPVHLCGRELENKGEALGPTSAGRHVRAHWRRGHWRRQAHGEGRQLRKLVWLMPMIVGAGSSSEDDVMGHVYLVS